MTMLDDLDLDILPDEAPHDEPPVVDLNELGAAFRRLAAAESRIKEIELTAARERERIARWEKDATASDRRQAEYHRQRIVAFAKARIAEQPKGAPKSLTTPYGRVELRSRQPEYVRDEEFRAWCEARGYVREKTHTEPDWATVKSFAERRGPLLYIGDEAIPGVVVKDNEDAATVVPYQ